MEFSFLVCVCARVCVCVRVLLEVICLAAFIRYEQTAAADSQTWRQYGWAEWHDVQHAARRIFWNVVTGARFIHYPAGTNCKVILSGVCSKQVRKYRMPLS
jgi:hypothetical protein